MILEIFLRKPRSFKSRFAAEVLNHQTASRQHHLPSARISSWPMAERDMHSRSRVPNRAHCHVDLRSLLPTETGLADRLRRQPLQVQGRTGLLVALVEPLGWYMTRVFNGERTFLSPVLRPVEAALYAVAGVDGEARAEWSFTWSACCSSMSSASFPILRHPALSGPAAVQSGRQSVVTSGEPLVQHRGELRHQHQLAELHGRDHDELSSRRSSRWCSQLPQRGDGHGHRDRGHPRHRAAHDEHAR